MLLECFQDNPQISSLHHPSFTVQFSSAVPHSGFASQLLVLPRELFLPYVFAFLYPHSVETQYNASENVLTH